MITLDLDECEKSGRTRETLSWREKKEEEEEEEEEEGGTEGGRKGGREEGRKEGRDGGKKEREKERKKKKERSVLLGKYYNSFTFIKPRIIISEFSS